MAFQSTAKGEIRIDGSDTVACLEPMSVTETQIRDCIRISGHIPPKFFVAPKYVLNNRKASGLRKRRPSGEVPLWSKRLCNEIRLWRWRKKTETMQRRAVVPGDENTFENSFSWMKYAKRYQMQKRDTLRRFFSSFTGVWHFRGRPATLLRKRGERTPASPCQRLSSTWFFFDTFRLALHAVPWRIFSHYTLIEFTSGEAFSIYLITLFAVNLPEWFVKC